MIIKKDDKYSNFLLILLILVLLGVIVYNFFDSYNVKHIIFEEQKIVRVKVEISEIEQFYKVNFTNESDMVKALTVRNKLRENKNVDPLYEGFYGNVHFTVYDEDGRERYDEFDDIIVEDYVWELLNLNSAKMQYVEELSISPEDIENVEIINPYTDEKIRIVNSEDMISDYSGLEVIDSLMVALKKDIMANPYVLNDAVCKFEMIITTNKNNDLIICDDYKNTLEIIDHICPEVKMQIEDLELLLITKDNVSIEITKEEFEDAKDTINDVLNNYLPFSNINSAIQLELVLNEELGSKHIFGSIHKDDMTENIYNLFE